MAAKTKLAGSKASILVSCNAAVRRRRSVSRDAPRAIAAVPTNKLKYIVGNSHGPTTNISTTGIARATKPPTSIRPQHNRMASGGGPEGVGGLSGKLFVNDG